MTATAGINHLAVVTEDLDRFVAFYVDVLGGELTTLVEEHSERHGTQRHALVDLGRGAGLHAFEQPGNPNTHGTTAIFDRGHLDHFGINVADEETFERLRTRLVEAGASDGTITDFGMVRSVSFFDPDGTDAELALWGDGPMLAFDDRIRIPYPA
jgi:catechol 2,3-dioxygenase-like lactoylglutathione lyase family enzyme